MPALATYLIRSSAWIERGALAGLFWPDIKGASAYENLRQAIASLKRAPYATGLQVERTRLRWLMPSDAAEFEAALQVGDLDLAAQLHAQGPLEPWSFDAYPEYQSWLDDWRTTSWASWREAVATLAARARAAGDDGARLRFTAALYRHHPDDDGALRQWALSLADSGRIEDARTALAAHAARLRHEYGSTGTSNVVDALDAALSGAPTTATAAAQSQTGPVAELRDSLIRGDRSRALAQLTTLDLESAWGQALQEREADAARILLEVTHLIASEPSAWRISARRAAEAQATFGESAPRLAATTHNVLADAAVAANDVPLAREHVRLALQAAQAAGDSFGVAVATSTLGAIEVRSGNLERAAALHEEALEGFLAIGYTWCAAIEHLHLGSVANTRGARGEATFHHASARTMFTAVGDPAGVGQATLRLGLVALERGAAAEALHLFDEAAVIWRPLTSRAATALRRAATRATMLLGSYERALEEAAAWAELLAQVPNQLTLFEPRYWRGAALLELGHIERAAIDAASATATWRELGMVRPLASSLSLQADVAALTGDLGKSRELAREALELREAHGDAPGAAVTRARLARLALREGDLHEAERLAVMVAEQLPNLDDVLRLRCSTSLARLYLELGRADEAHTHLLEAADLARQLELPPLAAEVALASGQAWATAGHGTEAAWAATVVRADRRAGIQSRQDATALYRRLAADLNVGAKDRIRARAAASTTFDVLDRVG